MDRKELRKRWVMGTIQPELFYIPWRKRQRNKHYVFIWANFWQLSKYHPTIQDYKQQSPNGFEYEFGFVIYNDKGDKVSDFSFGVSLPAGKYYAINYYSTGNHKISFLRCKIPFEVKDTDNDVFLYVDISSHIYYLNVKFKPELCEQTVARFQITQIVEGENDEGVSFYEERPACVPELERTYLVDNDGVTRNMITKLGLSSANDKANSWLGDYIVP